MIKFTLEEAKLFLATLEKVPEMRKDPRCPELIDQSRETILNSGEYDHGKFDAWLRTSDGQKWEKGAKPISAPFRINDTSEVDINQ